MKKKILSRRPSSPTSAVQRYGDWRKGEPCVMLDNQTWLVEGKPDFAQIIFSQVDREARRTALAEAESEMRRAMVALRLELPDDVWKDVNKRFALYSHAAWDAHNG